jgi:hypothetical protein
MLQAEKINAIILCSVMFFEVCVVCKMIMKNILEPGRPQMTICHMHIGCWIRKATHTHNMLYFFSTAALIAPTYFITPYVRCLSLDSW